MRKFFICIICVLSILGVTGCNQVTFEEGDYVATLINSSYSKDYQEKFDMYAVEDSKKYFIVEITGEIFIDGETKAISETLTFTFQEDTLWTSTYCDLEFEMYRSTTKAIYGNINYMVFDGYEYLCYVEPTLDSVE